MRMLRLPGIALIVLPALLLVALFALATGKPTVAQSPRICHAAIVIDRSGLILDDDLDAMKAQINNLFKPGGLNTPVRADRIKLAFWSFSSVVGGRTNYNAPFAGYVGVNGQPASAYSTFQSRLASIQSGGGTNFEQGFGYHNGQPNTFDNFQDIVNQTNIIVFMTDGEPNTPGAGFNNPTARNVARAAVLKHKAAGRIIIGGMVGSASQASLNYVLNGSNSNSTNTFRVSGDYSDLTRVLTQQIGTTCDRTFPPDTSDSYSLLPVVTSNDRVASGAVTATFSYSIHNQAEKGNTNSVRWSVKRLLVSRGQSIAPLYYGNDQYRDGYSCAALLNLVNNEGTCTDAGDGQQTFTPGSTVLDSQVPGATNVVLDDSWPVGTKLCYVLTVDRPTENSQPVDRYSRAACITIGKRPLVQVHGGDIRVGRHFTTDPIVENTDDTPRLPASIETSITPKADGKTYGSWAEYGVIAPGLVVGFASLSGLEGGYESTLPNTQEFWSKLTFANTNNEYGLFTEDDSGAGTIPDTASALLSGREAIDDLSGEDSVEFNGTDVRSGLYEKLSGNLTIEASTIAKNKTIIVHVPDGTVTIEGNIHYDNGDSTPYTNISQIPQLVIIAKSIMIDPDVTRVDAWLIANSEEDGTISTCNDPDTLTSEMCNAPLTLNGPVMAHHLKLRRTGGAGPGGAAGDPAEIINLPGSTQLWTQSEGRSDVRAQTTFTTELPPYF